MMCGIVSPKRDDDAVAVIAGAWSDASMARSGNDGPARASSSFVQRARLGQRAERAHQRIRDRAPEKGLCSAD